MVKAAQFNKDKRLCPVRALRAYVAKTKDGGGALMASG